MAACCCCLSLLFLNGPATPGRAGASDRRNAVDTRSSAGKKKPLLSRTSQTPRNNRTGNDLLAEAERLRSEWKQEPLRIALERYRSAAVLFKEAGDNAGMARALLGAGEVLSIFGEQDEALGRYRRALQIVSAMSDATLEVDILNRVAEIEFHRGAPTCESHAQRACELAERAGYGRGRARALNNLGLVAYGKNDKAKAIDYFNRSLSLSSAEGDLGGQADASRNLGLMYGDSGSVSKAQEFFDRALTFARAAQDPVREARINQAVALAHTARAEWQRALDLYKRTVSLLRQYGDRMSLALALNGLGSLYEELGEVGQALANLRESLAISRKMGHPRNEALTLLHIASIYAEAGHEMEALRIYRSLIPVAHISQDQKVEVYALIDVGLIYESLGNFEKARACYDRAAAVSESLNPRARAYSQVRLGALYLRMKKPREARVQLDAAASLMEQAGDHAGESLVLYNIAKLKQYLGEVDSALSDVRQIIQAVEAQRAEMLSADLKTSYFGLIHRNYELLVDLLMQKHAREPAAGYDVAAFEASELGRARSLTETLLESRANLREGVPAELLERENVALVNLRKKALQQMALREARYKLTRTRPSEGENRAEKLTQNSQALESVGREITSLSAELDEAATQIAAERPKKYSNLLRSPRIGLKELQAKVLDTDSLALEYSISEERSYLWIVGRDSLSSYLLPGRAAIEREAYRFYKAMISISKTRKDPSRPPRSQTNLRDFKAARDRLSRTLLAPIEDIARSRPLAIIPDGALHYVPFAALIEPGGSQPLVVAHQLVTLPSLTVLLQVRDEVSGRPFAPKTLAVLADPVVEEHDPRFLEDQTKGVARLRVRGSGAVRGASAFEDGLDRLEGYAGVDEALNFVRLPFAAEEAAMLATLVPESERLVRTGFDANRQAATSELLSQFRMIHFATHGLLDFRHPKLSCLLLSRFDRSGHPQDGYLRLQDVYNMKLSADLVVLSACRTALGKEIRGEGLVGLTRGFLYAGAARVAASLWNVDDNASAKLMERFYEKMLGPEKLSPAAALRAAQIEMMREKHWEDPYFWAAFILHGEWK